jgi:pilus assembly protein CpaC
MSHSMLSRAAALSACLVVIAGTGLAWAGQPPPPAPPPVKVVASEFGSNFVPLGVGKSVVVDLPGDIKDVLVSDPKVANAVIRTSRRAYLIGAAVGQTSIFFFDPDGRQLGAFDIAVTRDLNGLRGVLRQMFPAGNVRAEGIGEGVLLTGAGRGSAGLRHRYQARRRRHQGGEPDHDQGPGPGDAQGHGRGSAARGGQAVRHQHDDHRHRPRPGTGCPQLRHQQPVLGRPRDDRQHEHHRDVWIALVDPAGDGARRRAAHAGRADAIPGESATFLAGGEFPIPGIPACTYGTAGALSTCTPSVDYKKYGVTLNFTPVVLGPGKISLKVITEVSDLSAENSLTLNYSGTNSTITVPCSRCAAPTPPSKFRPAGRSPWQASFRIIPLPLLTAFLASWTYPFSAACSVARIISTKRPIL